MREIVDAILKDCSTREVFSFSIRCAECGEVWKSRQIRFSKAGVSPLSEGKRVVFDTLYQKERERARNAAVKDAADFVVENIAEAIAVAKEKLK